MMIAQFGMPVIMCIIYITAVRADTISNETIMIGVRSRSEVTPAAGFTHILYEIRQSRIAFYVVKNPKRSAEEVLEDRNRSSARVPRAKAANSKRPGIPEFFADADSHNVVWFKEGKYHVKGKRHPVSERTGNE